jgi:ABC-type dipeptide/oligopeptide/nickel transport system permease subunit
MQIRGKISLILLIVIVLMAIFAPQISQYHPNEINLDALKLSPGADHLLGTDQKGRDIFTRILYGARVSLGIAFTAAFVSMSIGLLVGLLSGYAGGRVDTLVMSIVDLVLSFPSLLLAIGVSLILPPGLHTPMIALAVVGWASFARLIRGHVLSLREAPFIEAAKAVGASHSRVVFVHLFPQCIPLSLVMLGLKLGGFILLEASLSFLGLGAQPPTASWGAMISSGRAYLVVSPWMIIFPGVAIAITALCFNILGDTLSDRYGFRTDT